MRYRTLLVDDLDVLADATLGIVWRLVSFSVVLLTAVLLLFFGLDQLFPSFLDGWSDGRNFLALGLGMTGVGILTFGLWSFGLGDASKLEQPTMDVGGQVRFLVQETEAIDHERAEEWRAHGFEPTTALGVAAAGIGVLVCGTALLFYLDTPFRGVLALALATAVLHVLIRSDVAPVRPLSQHVGISLFGILAVLPFGVVNLLVVTYAYDAFGGPRPVLPGLSVAFLAGLAAVYCVTIYCLLLAYDSARR